MDIETVGQLDNNSHEEEDLGQKSQTTLDQNFKTTKIKGSKMIENATRLLNRATEQKNREAEQQLKLEQIRNSPGPGFKLRQQTPAHMIFCYMCRVYKEKNSTIVSI